MPITILRQSTPSPRPLWLWRRLWPRLSLFKRVVTPPCRGIGDWDVRLRLS